MVFRLAIAFFSLALFTCAYAGERIQVSRFAASGSYSSAITYGYTKEHEHAGSYTPESGVRTIKRHEGCPSLLESYQHFPLKKMVEIGYLTPQQAENYSKLSADLNPTQMTFYMKTDPNLPPTLDGVHNGIFGTDTNGKVLASLYSVSTYKMDVVTNEMTHVPLPLELEPKWKPVLDAHLPRQKRLFMWEFGRAAQDGAGEIDDLLRAATLGCLNDLASYSLAMGVNFNEVAAVSNVLIHANDKAHIIAYLRRHPTAQVIRHPLDPNEAALIVPMKEMIEKYKPAQISETLTKFIDATEGKIDAGQAMFVYMFLKRHRWEELNIGYHGVGTRNEYPIVFSPVTSGSLQGTKLTNMLLHEFGVPEDRVNAIMQVFSTTDHSLHVNAPGKYVDVTEPKITNSFYKPRRAQEISNLDPKEVRTNPYYVPSVLSSVYRHFMDLRIGQLSDTYKMDTEFYLNYDKALVEGKIMFGITTMDPEVSRVIRAFSPREVAEYKVPHNPHFSQPDRLDPELAFITRDIGKTYYMHFFSIDDIHRIGTMLFSQGKGAKAKASAWQSFYDVSNPEIF